MEEIIQILIFVGAMVIAVIGQNAKNKIKKTISNIFTNQQARLRTTFEINKTCDGQ